MARQQGTIAENRFIRGLITERTALSFPTDACTVTWNCVFSETGRVTRRLGLDLESDSDPATITYASADATAQFTWDQVGDDADRSFEVLQIGYLLHFYETTSSVVLSTNKKSFTIDLSDYTEGGEVEEVRLWPCDFTQGGGRLFIVNRYHPPLYIEYDSITDTIDATIIILNERDTAGLDDGLKVGDRPLVDISQLNELYPAHYYNLINQGWFKAALEDWESKRSDMPSDGDAVGYYRSSAVSDVINNNLVNNRQDQLNTSAPKGHFIFPVNRADRAGVLTAAQTAEEGLFGGGLAGELFPVDNLTGRVPAAHPALELIPQGTGSIIQSNTTGSANAFDSDTSTDIALASFPAYIGKNLGTAQSIGRVVLRGMSLDADTFSAAINLRLYGSNSSPTNSTDGTLLVEYAAPAIGSGPYTRPAIALTSDDQSTEYQYIWVRIALTSGSFTSATFSEVEFYTPILVDQYPSTVTYFNGRLFYSGFRSTDLSSVVYFTQVIERAAQYGSCYQINDPTSEDIPDILDSDGGKITINNMGEVQKILSFQDQILIIAKNGVWTVAGVGGTFAATSYSVRRISGVGSSSRQSVVDVKGIPVWWAEDGIYTVTYDPNYASAVLQSLTEDTIKQFVLDLPALNRQFVKGAYDRLDDVVYWVFNDEASLSSSNYWTYNKVLCWNVSSAAFYPWELNLSSENTQRICSIHYIQDGERESSEYFVKFGTIYDTNKLTFSHAYKTTYKDWADYAAVTSDADDEEDYLSYFISGFRVETQGMRTMQGMYIMPFTERETNASIFVQGIYSFTDSGNSGKWSTPQQGYDILTTLGRTHRAIKRKRLKIRGSGDALQLRFYSETGKPFTLIGWGIPLGSNQSV